MSSAIYVLTAGSYNLFHPHSIISTVYGRIKKHTHFTHTFYLYPSLSHTHICRGPLIGRVIIPVWLRHLLLWRKWLLGTHLCPPRLSPSLSPHGWLFVLLSIPLTLSLRWMSSWGAALRRLLQSLAMCQFRRLALKARHELIVPAGQTAYYNALQGPTAGVKRAQYLLIIYSPSLFFSF